MPKSKKKYASKNTLALLFIALPGITYLIINNYIPIVGTFIAFKKFSYAKGIWGSPWCGLNNFKFLFLTDDAWVITRNTLLYNLAFIVLGLVIALFFAISLNELRSQYGRKVYQTIMFLPYFMSWAVMTGIVTAFLNHTNGLMNSAVLPAFGKNPIKWYSSPKYWPFILTFINIWKGAGYGSVMYLASINNIDTSIFDAAAIDGAGKWTQIKSITLPLLRPMVIILTLMNIGKIFNTDIGLFYTVPQLGLNGILTKADSTMDTYVYTNLISGNSVSSINYAAAAAFFQSIVGFILVVLTNWIVKKIILKKSNRPGYIEPSSRATGKNDRSKKRNS